MLDQLIECTGCKLSRISPCDQLGAGGSGPAVRIGVSSCTAQCMLLTCNVTVTLINPPPPELVLRFGLMEGGGVSIINDGGGGRTR